MKILVTGKNGQVGFELQRSLITLADVIPIDTHDCDLSDPSATRETIRTVKPDIIINTAAYTAVDQAESDPDQARSINAVCPGILGEEAVKINALVIHFSTDYVFDGDKNAPYSEIDTPNPINVYGRTKLEGEEALRSSGAENLILRTSWVAGSHGNNFVKTILGLAAERNQIDVVSDQFGAPTTASLLANAAANLVHLYLLDAEKVPLGTYHLTAQGKTSWYEYSKFIVEQARRLNYKLKLTPENIFPVTSSNYPTPARRPANSCLNTSLIRKTFNIYLPDWQIGIEHLLEEMANG